MIRRLQCWGITRSERDKPGFEAEQQQELTIVQVLFACAMVSFSCAQALGLGARYGYVAVENQAVFAWFSSASGYAQPSGRQ
jgi:hypothetical protein